MRFTSLVQLAPKEFGIHFPASCRAQHLARLGAVTNLLHADPIVDLHESAVAPHLAEVDILVTGWKSRRIDARLRRQMPRLKLVAHLAGATLAGPVGNTGRRVGIIGASRIGRRVAEELRRHRVSVLLHDPFVSAEAAAAFGAQKVSMDELLAESDVVSLHQPLLPTTQHSFGTAEFAKMRDGTLLINTARGRIIAPGALEEAMADGRLFVVLDVTDPEPLPDASPLWGMPNVTLTPHIAGSFGCEVCDMTGLVLDDIERFTRGEPLQNEVVLADWERVA